MPAPVHALILDGRFSHLTNLGALLMAPLGSGRGWTLLTFVAWAPCALVHAAHDFVLADCDRNAVWDQPLYHIRTLVFSAMFGASSLLYGLSGVAPPLWFIRVLASGTAGSLPMLAVTVAVVSSLLISLQFVCIYMAPSDPLNWVQVRWVLRLPCCLVPLLLLVPQLRDG